MVAAAGKGAAGAEGSALPEKDIGWRWRIGGLSALTPGQARDAEEAFDHWLRKFGRYELNGFRVDELKDFVDAIQLAPNRACGLEALRPTATETPMAARATLKARTALDLAMRNLVAAHQRLIQAYRVYDCQFEALKVDASRHPPLELSVQALGLDRAAWQLSAAAMDATEAAAAAGCRISGSPLRHPFLVARTRRYLEAVFSAATDVEAPPGFPYEGDPATAEGEALLAVRDWVARYAAQDDAVRRGEEGRGIGKAERAAMLRWLEGIGLMETFVAEASRRGALVTATGYALSAAQRADLRGLRTEMGGYRSFKVDVALQEKVVAALAAGAGAAGGDDATTSGADMPSADKLALERKALERLMEMRDHHKARATYFWVRSFHFQKAAQAEAELMAPKLIAAVRREIEPAVTGQSGEVGLFVEAQTPETRQALGVLAEASLALVDGAKGEVARSLAGKATAAAQAIGAKAMAAARKALPALARRAAAMLAAIAPAAEGKKTPLEKLSGAIDDWRVIGLATADRHLRAAQDKGSKMSARHTLVGYARAIVEDAGLLARLRGADAAAAAWIEQTARSGAALQARSRSRESTIATAPAAPAPR